MWDRVNGLLSGTYRRLRSIEWKREEGQTLTEYALVLGVIVVGVIIALTLIGGVVKTKISSTCDAMTRTPITDATGKITGFSATGDANCK